jgi:hypothetical protein
MTPAVATVATLRRILLWAAALVWLAIVLVAVSQHEFWRDEVRALSIAVAAPSLWALPSLLVNEGHPVLWYALLHLAHQGLGSSLALPVVSVIVAAAAVLVFLFRSPFSLPLKLLFTFSVLPLYEYSVVARGYGLGMLLMFCFAALYPYRRSHPWLLALVLALLANASLHSLPVAGLLLLLWLWDELIADREQLTSRRTGVLSAATALIILAAAFAVYTALPDARSIVVSTGEATSARSYGDALAELLREPWRAMGALLPFPEQMLQWSGWRVLQGACLVVLILGLAVRTRLALALVAALVALGVLAHLFPPSLRHQGVLLAFVIVLYWLYEDAPREPVTRLSGRLHIAAVVLALPAVLLWNDALAVYQIRRDLVHEMSSSKALAAWLDARPQYREAILLGEPDYFLEALPYYASQRIYIPRESRFGTWVRFTTDARPTMSLGELLAVARSLKERERQSVLIALGFPASTFEQRTRETHSYNKVLTWTASEWQQFMQASALVASFRTALDETFDLYEIR